MKPFVTAAFIIGLWSHLSFGDELFISGTLAQGGLVIAKAEPGAHVTISGRTIQVDETGGFLFGLSHNHAPTSVIDVRFSDGTTLKRMIEVHQRSYDEQHINNLPQKMVTPPARIRERIAREVEDVRNARAHASDATHIRGPLIWPIEGPVTGVYGSRRILNGEPRAPHYGVDVAATTGTPVQVIAPGVVRLAAELYLSGNTVIVDHGHGVTSSYLHMQNISVIEDQQISQGQVIGQVGITGRTTGPHLDWRINWFEVRLDPELVVGPQTNRGASD